MAPFTSVSRHGVVMIDAVVDQAFRRALMDGAPDSVRPKMREALAALPNTGSYAHSVRYFGKELDSILGRTAPLVDALHRFLHVNLDMPGFKDWLVMTGFANDYRMIKALAAWAEMAKANETVH